MKAKSTNEELEQAKKILAETTDVMSGIYTAYRNCDGASAEIRAKYRMSNELYDRFIEVNTEARGFLNKN